MKKRLISILLTLLMVMSMFTGMSVSAYADDGTEELYVDYTLAQGDYVLRICQKLGINYYTCKEAIMALNNITSENGFRYLSVGEVVKIPVSDAAAIAIMNGGKPSGTGTTTGGTATGTVSSGATIAYYLIPYTMQRGETVLGVCNSLGISFANYADQIMKLNGISSWSKVGAGTTLLLPATKTPAVGTTCYAVVAHKVASGDTAYNLCQKYGVSYGGSTKLLQALNNTDNLAAIKVGKNFYMPVATTIKAAGTTTGGTTTGTTTGTTSGGTTSGTTIGTTTAAKSYDITANINTSYGSMAFYVNNKAVNEAKAGDTVTVVVTTNSKKAIDGLVVKYADGRADLNLSGNSFVMPACDVRVDANIKSGYNITINSNYGYKTAATVEGVSVSSASQGSSVKVVSTDPSYAVDSIMVYYSTLLGIKKSVTVNDYNCFVMPAKNVTVDVELAPVKTYNFYREDCENGGFDIQVDGSSVSKAAKGAKVTVVWEAASGYEIGNIIVTNKTTGANINVFNNSFTMPASDVLVKVEFIKNSNSIDIEAIAGGILRAYDASNVVITEADTGAEVTIKGYASESGYTGDIKSLSVVRKADGHRVNVDTTKWTFKMPAGGVVISGELKSNDVPVKVSFNSTGSENSVTLKCGNVKNTFNDKAAGSAAFAVGSTVELSTLARDSHAFTKFEVYINGAFDQELTDMANEQSKILVPDATELEIKAFFSAGEIEIGPAKLIGNGTVSYQVDNGSGFKAASSCKVGDTVKIIAKYPFSGVISTKDTIEVINNATGKALALTDDLTFKMPAEGVSITVNFVGKDHILEIKVIDVNGKDLGADSLMGVSINDAQSIAVNQAGGISLDVKSSDVLNFTQTVVGKNKYVIDNVKFEGLHTGDPHEGGLEYALGEFQVAMWDEDVRITIVLREKTEKVFSLANVSWNVNRGSVGSTVGAHTNPVVSTAEVGDIVYIVPKALDPYFVVEDSLTVVRNSDAGAFTLGKAGDPVTDGKIIPVMDGTKVVAWGYKMPEGGVTAHVNFETDFYKINFKVLDNNGTDVTADGFVALGADGTNILYDVSDGQVEDVEYKSGVRVAITAAGATLYKIESVVVDGVAVNWNNSFVMPAHDINMVVTLAELNPAPTTVNFAYIANDNSLGKLEFYADSALTQLLNNEAEVGKDVYIKAIMKDGYKLKDISVKNALDNTEIVSTVGANLYKFTMPEDGVIIKVNYEAIEYTLTIDCAAADDNRIQVRVGNSSTSHIVKKGDTLTVPYNTNIQFSMYDTNFRIVDITTTVGGVNTTTTNYAVRMPAGDTSVTFTLAAN